MYGAAADIPAKLATPSDARAAGFTGIGIKDQWVIHVDVRDGAVQTWRY